ncbi:MAG: PAS domain S-box protein, partial [Burkholderiales bacterium]|nr:PAS domain S-box protein [Burkholderiales bacterium]
LGEIMNSPVLTIALDNTINEAAERMLKARVRHLVVVDSDGKMAGLLSEHDLTHALTLGLIDAKLIAEGAFLHTLIDTIPDLVWLKDVNGVYMACNPRFERFFGALEKDIVGKTDYDFVSKDLADFFRTHDRMALEKDGPSTNEEWVTYADDGHRELLETIKTPMRDSRGKLMGVLGVARDITENRQIAHELCDSEEKLRSIFDAMMEGVVMQLADGRIYAANSSAERILGRTLEQLLGATSIDLPWRAIHEDGSPFPGEAHPSMVTLRTGERCHDIVMGVYRPDASIVWISINSEPLVRQGESRPYAVVTTFSDITRRIAAERAMRELNADLAATLQAIPDLLFELEEDGKYINLWARNPEFLAVQKEFLLGHTVNEMLPPEAANAVMSALKEAEEKGYSHGQIIRLGLPHGDNWFELSTSVKTALDASGKRFIMLSRNITERKLAEQALLESEREIREQKEFLASIFENALDAVVLMNADGVITGWSRQAENIFGWSRQEAVGRQMHETMIPVRYREAQARGMKHFLSTGEGPMLNNRVEILALHRDGGEFPVELSITQIRTAQGYAFSAFIRDISERKRMELQLDDYRKRLESQVTEESTKFRALVEQSLVGNYIVQDGFFRYVNAGFAGMFGYDTPEEIIDLIPVLQIVAPDDRNFVEGNIRKRLSGEIERIRFSFTGQKRDGTGIIVDVHGSAIEYHGEPAIIGTLVDITETRRSQEELERLVDMKASELRQSEEKLRMLIEAIPDPIQFKDGEGHWLESNFAARQTFGLGKFDPRGKTDEELSAIAEPRFGEALLQCRRTDEAAWHAVNVTRLEEIIPLDDGRQLSFDVIKKPLFREDGTRAGLVIVGRDITEIKKAEENLRISASVFDNSQEAVVITDANNTIVEVNPAFTRITGYSRDEVLGKNPKLLSSGRQDKSFYAAMWKSLEQEKAWRGEIWNRRKSGEIYAEQLSISAICNNDGKVQRHVGVFSDISHLKTHEAELSRMAHYDALTGIPNRVLLADRLNQAIIRAQRNGRMLAICYMDLDGFKRVNDQYGHETGDRLLVHITHRLQEALRAGDTVARLGGDEFVMLFNDLASEDECFQVLDRILEIVAMPVIIGGNEILVSASIGVTFYPADDEDGDTLLRHADQAMYVAKQTGKNRYHLYDSEHDQRLRFLHKTRRRIQQGLNDGEFELFYQPKVELVSGKVMGAEALIRWHHPERGLLLPAEFLPSIENSDVEIQVGEWVMDTALAQLDAWRGEGFRLEISINISAHHLQSPDFASTLRSKLTRYPQLPPNSLQIEVLETAALRDIVQSSETIEICRGLGVSFALDDFGTGYSSLAYLRKLLAETLKIDQSFVHGMLTDEGDHAIVQGIVALAKTFHRQTVAEGIEAPEHIRILIELGCLYGQGYGIARPMPTGDFLKWHKERK